MDAARPHAINLGWLVRLRWAAIAGQLVTIVAVAAWLDITMPWGPLLAVVAVEAASNLAAGRAGGGAGLLVGLLCLDLICLTALLYLTGGPHNPFNFLYLVYIALGAIVLPPRATWWLTGLSVALFGLLFLDSWPLQVGTGPHAAHRAHTLHVRGMWVAFVVAAAFIVYFTSRIAATVARQREALERAQRLGALGTLAAGAAHELGTPLSTIAVVAEELLAQAPDNAEDIELIREQVRRCREVLDQLGADAGRPQGEAPETVRLVELLERAVVPLPARDRVQWNPQADLTVAVRPRAFAQALRSVIQNGLEAGGEVVRVASQSAGAGVAIEVRDTGSGMDDANLARAGEPFFTTKEGGMGLGLYLARSVVERSGGALEVVSQPGSGTTVTLTVPGGSP